MDAISTLLLGLGNIGMAYDIDPGADEPRLLANTCASHARALTGNPQFDLIGAVDPSPDARARFSSLYGLPAWGDAKVVPDHGIDLVVIAAPTQLHVPLAVDAIRRYRPGWVFCEKPSGRDAADANVLREFAASAGTEVLVNYFRRYLPETRDVGRLIKSAKAGRFRGGAFQYSHVLRVNGCHFVDLLSEWLGPPVTAIRLPDGRTGTDETPSFMVSFENGDVTFSGMGSCPTRVAEGVLAFDGGLLTYQMGGADIAWRPRRPGSDAPGPPSVRWTNPLDSYQRVVYEEISEVITIGARPSCSIDDAIRILEIIDEVT